jgi:hypothetical protein
MKKIFLFLSAFVITAGLACTVNARGLLTGKYSCFDFNIAGRGGGSCYTFPQLILRPDGTYKYDTDEGRWYVRNNKLYLSKEKSWGPGTIIGNYRVYFQYYARGLHYTVTWNHD